MRPLPFLLLTFLGLTLRAADVRQAPPKDLDGYFPFTPPADAQAWAAQSADLRRHTQVALGLWPEPTRTPLNARVGGRVERDDYTVERVVFESLPGLFVTGSLYRPKDPAAGVENGRRPAVLCPHGHWAEGRFFERPESERRKELESGSERFPGAALSHIQARCVQLARMGCVVLHTDMLGYADSRQLSFDLVHKFAKQRPELERDGGWGFFGPRAELELQSVLGLQTWGNIRALDFLATLPDVDPARIGVTGASGGGTQTFLLGAVDPRPAALFPAVMVSTAMQGGCTCENASLLRVHGGNIHLAALIAPRPLGLTAANDWTKEMATKGFPELQRLYATLGAPDHVRLTALTQFGHNFNSPSRAALAEMFNRHLRLGRTPEQLAERDFTPLTRAEMTVWDAEHPAPTGDAAGEAFERRLLAAWQADTAARVATNAAARAEGWRRILLRDVKQAGDDFEYAEPPAKTDRRDWMELRATVRNLRHQEEVKATFLYPTKWNGRVVLWLDGRTDASEEVERVVRNGSAVVLSALFAPEAERNPVVKNPREAPSYTYGYNPTLFARRAHDALTLLRFCQTRDQYPAKAIDLAGFGPQAPLAAAVRFLAGDALERVVLDPAGFTWKSLSDWRDPLFLPGACRYGDLDGLLSLPGAPYSRLEPAGAVGHLRP